MSLSSFKNIPNIGPVIAKRLEQVGITSLEQLKSVGAENAFIRLASVDPEACVNELMALEGAIQGIRWHGLDQVRKQELKAFYQMSRRANCIP